MRRLLWRMLAYMIFALLMTLISVGLINSYLGVDSPLGNWRPMLEARVPELPELPQISKRLPRSGTSGEAWITAARGRAQDDPLHGAGDSPDTTIDLCALPGAPREDEGGEPPIYSWVSEDGVMSFSDEPPDAQCRPRAGTPP